MKVCFILFVLLLLTIGCSEENKKDESVNKCLAVQCDEWKECNPSTGFCELKSGKCDSVFDCNGNRTKQLIDDEICANQSLNGFPKEITITNVGTGNCTVNNIHISEETDSQIFWVQKMNGEELGFFPIIIENAQSFSFLVMFKPTAVQAQ